MFQKYTIDFQTKWALYLQVKNDILESERGMSLAKNTNPPGCSWSVIFPSGQDWGDSI